MLKLNPRSRSMDEVDHWNRTFWSDF
jgi:hypothetical protein